MLIILINRICQFDFKRSLWLGNGFVTMDKLSRKFKMSQFEKIWNGLTHNAYFSDDITKLGVYDLATSL